MNAIIFLTQGKWTFLDWSDYEKYGHLKWYYHHGYATRNINTADGQRQNYLHRTINNTPESLFTDHINGNKLNNLSINLRKANSSQNNQNVSIRKNKRTSIYKGVSYHKASGKYQAAIQFNNKYIYLGLFDTPEKASIEYDVAAYVLFDEFVRY